jgi:putative membrane protein
MKKLLLIGSLLLFALLQACTNDANDSEPSAYQGKQPVIFIEPGDKQFAVDAAHIGLAEIELGKLAIKNGADKKVKNFGSLLIKQHTKIGARLLKTATQKKIELPTTVDTATHRKLAGLAAYSGKEFDKAFLNFMVDDHEDGIKFFEQTQKHVVDKDLKKVAQKNLLILHRHVYALNGIKAILKY